jgi:hypothetical protein
MGCDYDSNHHDHITFLGITLTSDHTTDQCYTEAEIQPRQHRKRNYVPPSQQQHLPAPPPPHHVGGARKRVSTHKKPRPSRPPQQTLQDLAGDNNYRLPPTKNTNHSGSDRRPRRDHALPISATTSTRKPATKRQHSHIDAEARDHRDLYPKEASRLEAKLATLQCLTKNPTAPTQLAHQSPLHSNSNHTQSKLRLATPHAIRHLLQTIPR